MRTVVLGKSGLEVSAVGFGGIPIQRLPEEEAARVVRHALDLGVTFIDTASGYTDSQKKIGRALKGRDRLPVLATKSGRRDRAGALEDVRRSRLELGVDTVDLYQLHGVSSEQKWEEMSAPGGALEGLLVARDRGWIDHIGFTSHSLDVALGLVEEEVFETVQFPFNLVTREPGEELIPKAGAKGLGFIVMKPLCGGQYHDAQLAFKFLNSYPELVPIPGIEKAEEIEEIVGIVRAGQTLQGEQRERAEEVARKLGRRFCRRCGYCQPCPQGVPITLAMVFEGMVNRLPRERIEQDLAPRLAREGAACAECGECEEKCPYDLPIIETVARSRRLAAALAGN
jgi:predicted aldo/keto reductase-like oxidoreductase